MSQLSFQTIVRLLETMKLLFFPGFCLCHKIFCRLVAELRLELVVRQKSLGYLSEHQATILKLLFEEK